MCNFLSMPRTPCLDKENLTSATTSVQKEPRDPFGFHGHRDEDEDKLV